MTRRACANGRNWRKSRQIKARRLSEAAAVLESASSALGRGNTTHIRAKGCRQRKLTVVCADGGLTL
jgi:hypothetical protein